MSFTNKATNQNNHVLQSRFSSSGSVVNRTSKSDSGSTSSSSRANSVKKKDESPPVTPDSTTDPPPRPPKLFQEGDDVFFQTDDGQHVLGTVGQIVGQTCQVLFGDGTQQWASFKRIKKLSAAFDDEEDTVTKVEPAEPSHTKKHPKQNKSPQKEESIEMFCTVCGVKKKISVSKARTFKPEGPNVFKCRKCSKLAETETSGFNRNASSTKSSFYNPSKTTTQGKPIPPPNQLYSTTKSTSSQSSTKPITKTASGTMSVLHASATLPDISNCAPGSSLVRNFGPNLSTFKRRRPSICFSCEKDIEPDGGIQCNLCGRPCHLICLPLTCSPLKGDKFWDLMCSSCGTQNNDASRVRVFSVRRNISSWTDVAHLALSCIAFGKAQLFFDLDTEILPFLDGNMNSLHLPRQYKLPTPDDRKKFILHALYNCQVRFVNGKEYKKRATLWGLRREQLQVAKKEATLLQVGIGKATEPERKEATPSLSIRFIPPVLVVEASRSPSKKHLLGARVGGVSCDNVDNKFHSNEQGTTGKKCTSSFNFNAFNQGVEVPTQLQSQMPKKASNEVKLKKESLPEQKKAMKRSLPISSSPSTTTEKSKKPKLSGTAVKLPIQKSSSFSSHDHSMLITPSPVKKTVGPASSSSSNSSHKLQTLDLQIKKRSSAVTDPGQQIEQPNRGEYSSPDKSKPRAVKSANIIPVSAQKILTVLKENEIKVHSSPEKKALVKPKVKTPILKTNIIKHSATAISKLRLRGRGRPLGAKKSIPHKKITELVKNHGTHRHPKLATLKLTRTANGITVSKSAGIGNNGSQPTTSKRIADKNVQNQNIGVESIASSNYSNTNLLGINNTSFMDAVLYGNYRVQCLPNSPRTDEEQRAELRKVYGHFRTEKQNETASLLLGRSETETRSQSRRKSELFGRQKRDLNNFDSYDVVAKRVDENGITQYFVVWKGEGGDDGSDVEDDCDEDNYNHQNANEGHMVNVGLGTVAGIPNDSDEEMPQVVAEVSPRTFGLHG